MKMDTCKDGCCLCSHRTCMRRVALFSNLSEDKLDKISKLVRRKRYGKDERILSEGDEADRLLIVSKGSLKAFTYNREGKEQILYFLHDGDFLGELNLLKKSALSFNVETLEETHLCMVYREDFNALLADNPDIVLNLMEHLCNKITGLEQLIQTITTKDTDTKLAALLMDYSTHFGKRSPNGIEIDIPLTREEMANHVGVTRETISRKLSSLQSLGVIELASSGKIIIKDEASLKSMAL